MMDYYEELGLDRSASPEDIRQAYRRLVRILHPDRCRDDQLRRLADLQMKRLNAILKVLTDPEGRELYDRDSAARLYLPGRLDAARRVPRWFWPAAATACLLILVALTAYTPQPQSALVQIAPEETSASVARSSPPSPKPAIRMNPRISGPTTARSTPTPRGPLPPKLTTPEPDDSPPVAAAIWPRPVEMPAVLSQIPRSEPPPAHRAEQTAHAPPNPQLTGVWLLIPSPHSKNGELYRPEYIELRLTEDAGILHGRYQARYHIPDRAISPVVSFQFEGQAAAGRATLPWSGTGGARGEVELRMLTPTTLEISWVANHLSDGLDLIAGTATLVRKLD